MKFKNVLRFLILNCALIIVNCSENPSKPPPVVETRDTITVSIEQETHRSVTLRLTKKLKVKSDLYVLNRIEDADTFSLLPFHLSPADTLIIDDKDGAGLTIDSEYRYFAYRLDSTGAPKDTGNTVTTKTLAATSHDFSWTEYTLGAGELYDVWGTSENNVYAVGGVSFGDSTVGIIHWDGVEWQPITAQAGGFGIYGFSENDIWVVSGNPIFHFDGNTWSEISDNVIDDHKNYRAIWGTSSENLYFGNDQGKIIHWDGQKGSLENIQARKPIQDIWGFSENSIFAVSGGGSGFTLGELFYYNGHTWNLIETADNPPGENGLWAPFATLWGMTPSYLSIGGARVYMGFIDTWQLHQPGYLVLKVRGNNTNDVWNTGHFGGLQHFNGVSWDNQRPSGYNTITFNSLWTINDLVFVVGSKSSSAYIYQGTRN